ncbi:MAG: NUDIX domain-containing protein [Beijerinckiaceae bacterium]
MPLHFSELLSLPSLKRLMPFPRLGVRGLVIDPDGEVLLVRHTYIGGWYLPGGGVEKGESAEASLARELAEEANVEIAERPQLHGLFFNPKASPRDHVACYVVRKFRQSAPHVPDFEIAEARFFAASSLPDETTRATRARIEEVFCGLAVAETW